MRDKLRLTAADLGASQFLCVRLVARSLPPHPCPLPRGEGEPFAALEYLARAQTLHALAAFSLSPRERAGARGKGPRHQHHAQKLRCS